MIVRGGCHCGAVRFEAEVPDPPVPALDCNCSVCRMTGYMHINVPHEDFELLSGRDVLASYRFGTGAAEHLFCSQCGVKSFYQPRSHPGCAPGSYTAPACWHSRCTSVWIPYDPATRRP